MDRHGVDQVEGDQKRKNPPSRPQCDDLYFAKCQLPSCYRKPTLPLACDAYRGSSRQDESGFRLGDPEEEVYRLRVKVGARQRAKALDHLLLRQCTTVRTIRPQGIPHIYHGKNPR